MDQFKVYANKLWILVSICLLAFGSMVVDGLQMIGLMSLTLAVGYATKPSHRILGWVSFGFTVLLVLGIACKVAHLNYADFTIGVALAGVVATFGYSWATRKL